MNKRNITHDRLPFLGDDDNRLPLTKLHDHSPNIDVQTIPRKGHVTWSTVPLKETIAMSTFMHPSLRRPHSTSILRTSSFRPYFEEATALSLPPHPSSTQLPPPPTPDLSATPYINAHGQVFRESEFQFLFEKMDE